MERPCSHKNWTPNCEGCGPCIHKYDSSGLIAARNQCDKCGNIKAYTAESLSVIIKQPHDDMNYQEAYKPKEREIKFRAKEETGERWIYGGGVWTFTVPSNFDKPEYQVTLLFGPDDEGKPQVTRVKSKTVGEYIGLKDKDGNEIFEGDIIKTSRGEIGVVKWSAPIFTFRNVFNNEYHLIIGCNDVDGEKALSLSVIGNIYQNPELLK